MKQLIISFLKSFLKTILLAVPHLLVFILTWYVLYSNARNENLIIYDYIPGSVFATRITVKGEILEKLLPVISIALLFIFSVLVRFVISTDFKQNLLNTCKLFRNFCFIIITILIASCFFDDWLVYEIRDNKIIYIAFALVTILLSVISCDLIKYRKMSEGV
jgi:hypothetical protein